MKRLVFIGLFFFYANLFAQSGLIASFPFNGNANDESGNGIDGTVNGATLTTDRFENANSAYSFDGVDDDIKAAHNSLLNITEQISLAAWIFPTAQKTQTIIRKGPETSSPYGLSLSGSGDIVFSLNPNSQFTQARKTGYTQNEWAFVVGTYDGTMMKLFVNGQLETSVSISGSLTTNSSPLQIGTRLNLAADTFSGKLDDLRVFSKALSETKIQSLFNENVTAIHDNETYIPAQFSLGQNYPNPFNPTTVINYQLLKTSEIELTIYNQLGQKVRTLVSEIKPAGAYQAQWDSRDNSGKQVANGVYLYRLQTGSFMEVRKMVLLR